MLPKTSKLPTASELREKLGMLVGASIAPLFLIGSSVREARFFHPRGICFTAVVRPARAIRLTGASRANLEQLAQRLSGEALVRLSSALWWEEHKVLPNLLGFSIRFKTASQPEHPGPEAQDLLTATARSPWTLALDSLRTNQHDFLCNHYYGISPFAIENHKGLMIRVSPVPVESEGKDRFEKLSRAVEAGNVQLLLEVQDKTVSQDWQPVVEIQLQKEVEIDEDKLQFWPFRNGQGIRPHGFIHYLRPMPYLASRLGRSKVDRHEIKRLEVQANAFLDAGAPSAQEPTPARRS